MTILPLSEMTIEQLRSAAKSPFRKWGSAAVLRLAGLKTVDGVLVEPGASAVTVRQAVEVVSESLGAGKVMIRSDGGQERGRYPHAGFSHDLDESVEFGSELIAMGRAVLVLRPTDRLSQSLSANVRLANAEGVELVAELMGQGFDCSDLNRRGVLPQVSIILELPPGESVVPWPSSFRTIRHMASEQQAARVAARTETLEQMELGSDEAVHRFGESLWECPDLNPTSERREDLAASLYAAARSIDRTATSIGIALGVFSFSYAEYLDGSHLYLDVVSGRGKYAID